MQTFRLFQKPPVRITVVYFFIATVWILFSDTLLLVSTLENTLISSLSILKGMGFVVITSAILYLILRREFAYRFRLEDELRTQMQRLKASQMALSQSEGRFRKAIEEAPSPILIFAEDGIVLSISRAWLEITGYTRDQLTTIDAWTMLAYGERQQPVREGIDRLFALAERVDEGEFTITCADGSQRVWAFTSTPLDRLSDGRRIVMSIASDLTRQKQAASVALENERLKARFQKEQERNAFVQRIISTLSHDLRTPLTVIASAKDMLLNYFDKQSAEKRTEKLESIGRQVQFAIELLNDTVNIVRGNLDDVPFRPEPVNLDALCRISIGEVRAAYEDQHRIRFIPKDDVHIAHVDESLVTRILLNLLSNAIKYSPDDSEIRLELDSHDESIILRVIDQGMGINQADLPHIFEPFYRTGAVKKIKGTGLGLSIVKDCVDRHQGRVYVESTLGEGSTFTVELPFALEATSVPASV